MRSKALLQLLLGLCVLRHLLLPQSLLAAQDASNHQEASGIEETSVGVVYEPYVFEPRVGDPVSAELGTFTVPENRSRSNSRTLELRFVRFASTSKTPGPPIVYLAGGPGGSGIDTARGRRFPLFMKLREVADVIAFDQRGTGLSNSIPECEVEDPVIELMDVVSRESALTAYEQLSRHCAAYWKQEGVDLGRYNTAESADDLEALRLALGVETIDLWGISYGTHLGLATVKRHPQSIRRVVFASSEGLDETVKLPSRTQAYLEHVGELVRQDRELGKMVPNLVGLMQQVLDELDRKPVAVKTVHPATGQAVELMIGKLEVQSLTGYLIKNPDTLARLPLLYLAMSQGDYSFLAPYLVSFKELRSLRGMPEAMDAASGISPARARRIERERGTAVLGDALNFPGPAIAEALGVTILPESFRAPFRSTVPALFLSGTLDGRTYVESARETASQFEGAIHLLVDGAGHDLFMETPEVGHRIAEFLRSGTTSDAAIELPAIEFAKP